MNEIIYTNENIVKITKTAIASRFKTNFAKITRTEKAPKHALEVETE